jgi:hypothetical protein
MGEPALAKRKFGISKRKSKRKFWLLVFEHVLKEFKSWRIS